MRKILRVARRRLASSLLRLKTEPAGGLLVVLLACGVMGVVYFRFILDQSSLFIFSDLPGIYVAPPLNSSWLGTLAVYPLTEQLGSFAFGNQTGVHNLLFVASLFAPAVGAYAFLIATGRSVIASVVGSVAVGTIVNPALDSVFLGGGFEYGFWILFVFLTMAFLWRARVPSRAVTNAALAGLMLGLSASESYWFTALAEAGIILVAPLILGLLAYSVFANRHDSRRMMSVILVFFGVTALITLPILYTNVLTGASVQSNSAQSAVLTQYVLSNVAYSFRPYGFVQALFNGAPGAGFSGYFVSLPVFWLALVTLAIVGAGMELMFAARQRLFLGTLFLSVYLLAGAFLVAAAAGNLTALYGSLRPVDSIDSPIFLVLVQLLTLPYMLSVGIEHLGAGLAKGMDGLRELFRRPTSLEPVQLGPVRRGPRSKKWPLVATSIVLAIAVAGSYGPNAELPNRLQSASQLIGQSPFAANGSYSALGRWYQSQAGDPAGEFLPIPNDYQSYNDLAAYIPEARLWSIPLAGPQVASGYDTSSFKAVLTYLAEGNLSTFANSAGIAGVEYIVLLTSQGNVTVYPGYLGNGTLIANASNLLTSLEAAPEFLQSFQYSGIHVFNNRDYQASVASFSDILLVSPESTTTPIEESTVSSVSNFTNWSAYLGESFRSLANGTAMLTVNGSSSVPYVVFWTTFPYKGGVTSELTIDPTWIRSSFSISDHFGIPSQISLAVMVFWYNTTTPGPFFSQFFTTALGSYNSSAEELSATFSPPPGAVLARLVMIATASDSRVEGGVFIDPPTLTQTLEGADLSQDGALQWDLLGGLEVSGDVPPNSEILTAPLNRNLSSLSPGCCSEAMIFSAGAADPTASAQFSMASLFDNHFPSAVLTSIAITGVANSSEPGRISVAWSSSRQQTLNASGQFTLSYEGNASVAMGYPEVSVTGNLTLSTITIIAWAVGSTEGNLGSIPLPIGSLAIRSEEGRFNVVRSTDVLASTKYANLPADYVPISCLLAVVAALVIWPRVRRARPIER